MTWLLKFFPGTWWVYAIAAGVIFTAGGTAAYKFQGMRLDAVKAEYAGFVGQVKTIGEAAQKAATAKAKQDTLDKQKADDENKRTTDTLNATIKRLRSANPPSSNLPAAPAGTSRPDLLCLDRAEYQRESGAAIKRLWAGTRSLADEGTKNTVDLNTAKIWAQK